MFLDLRVYEKTENILLLQKTSEVTANNYFYYPYI